MVAADDVTSSSRGAVQLARPRGDTTGQDVDDDLTDMSMATGSLVVGSTQLIEGALPPADGTMLTTKRARQPRDEDHQQQNRVQQPRPVPVDGSSDQQHDRRSKDDHLHDDQGQEEAPGQRRTSSGHLLSARELSTAR